MSNSLMETKQQEENPKNINVYIPFKNRERKRLLRCIKYIKNNSKQVDKIIVIDNSTKPIKPIKGVVIERITFETWNKAFLLNKAIKKYPNEYIMTVDTDMLLDKIHFRDIEEHLDVMSFIIDTNVRRIEQDKISDKYEEMVFASGPWRANDTNQLINTANGGFQVYSYKFWEHINGIQEGLGWIVGPKEIISQWG